MREDFLGFVEIFYFCGGGLREMRGRFIASLSRDGEKLGIVEGGSETRRAIYFWGVRDAGS